MPRPDFTALGKSLFGAGVAPAHASRMADELEDHFDDLVRDALNRGLSQDDAEREASQAIGETQAILTAARSHAELRSWACRWPKVALVFYPVACIVLLPAVPLRAGIEHASEILRWTACIAFGALATAIMFLALQLSITLA